MKVVLIGASGFVGTQVLKELLDRGHKVTAITRNPEKIIIKNENLTVKGADVFDPANLAALIAGHEAVISAYNAGWTNPNYYDDFIKASEAVEQAVKNSGVKRFLVVGGAGSLEIAPGVQLVDTPEFPAEYKTAASAARDYLNTLRKNTELNWTFLSPAINLHPGERTGKFRLGTDQPVFDEHGKSEISAEDLAVAIVDEINNNNYIKRRFTVGY
jgi:putative NADH-flavin reductase